ncbi:unnamed protein product, partial [Rotaria magnacalcarata]
TKKLVSDKHLIREFWINTLSEEDTLSGYYHSIL